MEITEIPVDGYECVAKAVDPESGLRAFISVHDTTLGPSLGGLRMWPYASDEDALFDVNRLSQGMTYKSAIAKTGVGGGKAVIIGDPARDKSEALYLAMGRFIDSLEGRYITAEDVNTAIEDLEIVRRATKYVTGLSREAGGSGNPSPVTAWGVFLGIRAALERCFGSGDMGGRRIGVQGVGAVGSTLVRHLVEAGAKVMIADMRQDRVDSLAAELGVQPVSEEAIFTSEYDVFAPCALGAVINDETVPKLRCRIVAGAANNLLLEPRHGEMLRDHGILYAPDYVINAAGIINVAAELWDGGYNRDEVMRRVARIPEALHECWALAEEQNLPSSEAADRIAEGILAEARLAKERG